MLLGHAHEIGDGGPGQPGVAPGPDELGAQGVAGRDGLLWVVDTANVLAVVWFFGVVDHLLYFGGPQWLLVAAGIVGLVIRWGVQRSWRSLPAATAFGLLALVLPAYWPLVPEPGANPAIVAILVLGCVVLGAVAVAVLLLTVAHRLNGIGRDGHALRRSTSVWP